MLIYSMILLSGFVLTLGSHSKTLVKVSITFQLWLQVYTATFVATAALN